MCVGLLELVLAISLECFDTVTAIQVHSNLLISLHKHFKFLVQVSMVVLEDGEVLLASQA